MVNHFLLENDELIGRLIQVIEESLDVRINGHDEYIGHEFNHERHSEYSQIKKEILERMNK